MTIGIFIWHRYGLVYGAPAPEWCCYFVGGAVMAMLDEWTKKEDGTTVVVKGPSK